MATLTAMEVLNLTGTSLIGAAGLAFTVVTWFVGRRSELEKRDDQLLAWGTRGLEVMANIESLCLHGEYWAPDEFNRRKSQLAAEASTVLDQGRIFFPNIDSEGRRDSSENGFRPKILDELRLAYLVAEDISPDRPDDNRQRRDELWNARGRFVGYLRVAVSDKRKRQGEAGEPGRSVALAALLPGRTGVAAKPGARLHRR
jgi:hypothetical protein